MQWWGYLQSKIFTLKPHTTRINLTSPWLRKKRKIIVTQTLHVNIFRPFDFHMWQQQASQPDVCLPAEHVYKLQYRSQQHVAQCSSMVMDTCELHACQLCTWSFNLTRRYIVKTAHYCCNLMKTEAAMFHLKQKDPVQLILFLNCQSELIFKRFTL